MFQENSGLSALMIASQNGHTEVVKLLLGKGAQVNMQENSGWSALMIASENGHTEVVKLLLEKVNMQINYGLSALYLAVKGQHTQSVMVLFQHGAKVSKCDDQGTPLLTKYDILKIDQCDNRGKTALMYASSNGNY